VVKRLFGLFILAVLVMAPMVSSTTPGSAQEEVAPWLSTIIWQPTLADAGTALTEHLNQIDAGCSVDVDPVVAANGMGPEGAVYAFAVVWNCLPGSGDPEGDTWQSAIIWQPNLGDAGLALAELLNQIHPACRLEVEPVVPTAGTGPEGPVYAFLAVWAC